MTEYKLKHKTIGFGFSPETGKETKGIDGLFFIPSYQRGYRWTEDDVARLLDDISESDGKPYSLQPIVVKPMKDDAWELIDGQQRLTTLWLIFNYMHKEGYKRSGASYRLEYETRPGSQTYLQTLDAEQAMENIDYFHMYQAHSSIGRWFNSKTSNVQAMERLINKIHGHLCDSVRVIWYEIPFDTPSIPLFTRLNQGRIPLTDAELIKAVLLTKIADKIPGRETEVAAQWDGIERDLQREEIWAFVAGSSVHDDERHGTRINLLLDTLADKPGKGAVRYHTFDKFRGEVECDAESFWKQVVALHAQILGWFEDPRLYNKIGFLVAIGKPIGVIQRLALGQNKSAFDELLTARIKDKLNVSADDLDEDLRYDDPRRGYPVLFQLLLLFNVQICRERFPFEKHGGQDWSLEHIHAQNAQSLTRAEQWETWLREHQKALPTIKTPKNENDINCLLQEIEKAIPDIHTVKFGERFHALSSRIQEVLNPQGVLEAADHTIANLALLSHGANAALSNAVFEVKRQKVLEMDREGQYIPVATRNVFLKYFTDADSLQPHFWSATDKASYLSYIKRYLSPYLR